MISFRFVFRFDYLTIVQIQRDSEVITEPRIDNDLVVVGQKIVTFETMIQNILIPCGLPYVLIQENSLEKSCKL